MLALSDGALAIVIRSAAKISVRKRSRWLQETAARLEAPTQNAVRSKRTRQRRANGRGIFRLELDVVAVEEMLTREGLLPTLTELSRSQVERALSEFVSRLAALSAE